MLVVLLVLLAPALPVPPGAPRGPGEASGSPVAVTPASAGGVQTLAAALSFGLTASPTQADPKDVVTFTVYFNNTGTQAAPAAWINVSASSRFTFLGDTAAGNVSGYPTYRFDNVSLGLHAFGMRFMVDVGTNPGSRISVSAGLIFADGMGGQQYLGPASASVLVGVVSKPLYLASAALNPAILTPVPPTGGLLPTGTYTLVDGGPALSFDLTPALAHSFRVLNATATLYLQPAAPPATLDVSLTLLDVNGAATNAVASVERNYTVTGTGYWTLSYAFPSFSYTFWAGHVIRLQVLNAAATLQSVSLATNATAEPSHLDVQTTTYVNIDTLRPSAFPTTYLSPKSSLVVTANVSDPFGSSEIVAAHLNVTGPTGVLSGWTDAFPVVAVDPSSPSAWKVFQRTFGPPLANGTYTIEVTAVERNGVLDIADTAAVVRAPAFTLQKTASPNQGKTGTHITYFVWYNNTGTGPAARVWINDTLPSQVSFQNASTNPSSTSGNTYGWVFNSVQPGAHVLQVFVRVSGGVSGVAYIRNWAGLNDSDPQGFLWPSLTAHADVVINGPVLALLQSSTPAAMLHANESALCTISVTNTGDAAGYLWLNDTLPAGLTWVSDTATAAGGSRSVAGNRVDWTFPGMASGASTPTVLSFTMTVQAGAALPWGTVLPNVLGLNDTSTNGVLMPDQLSVLRVTVAAPSIASAAASFGVPAAAPNQHLPLYVNFTNAGNEAAGATWINLTLGASLTFVNASASANVTGTDLSLRLPSAGIGANSVEVLLAAAPTVVDRQALSVSGDLRTTDGYGNLLPNVTVAAGSVLVALPDVAFRLDPTSVSAESGTPMAFTLTGQNTGTGTASVVWLNLTLPAQVTYVSDTFGATPTAVGTSYSWAWSAYAPGSHTYTLVLLADHLAPDGASANVSFHVEALDTGGNVRSSSSFGGLVSFRAPAFALSTWASANETAPGRSFTYTLVAENVGSTTAQTLWLTDTVDSRLTVVYYSSTVPATGTSTLNWTFQDVAPGQRIEITITVSVAEGIPGNAMISNTFTAQYTNSAGTVLAYERSSPATVSVMPDLTGLFLILGLGSALGALAIFVVYRRYRVRIEDVFLIYRDGILISHLSRGDSLDKDEDQLSGMLTAVQEFVKDAFTYGEDRELHQLEFGDYHVLIERGTLVYLAVVYQGRDSGLIRKKVRAVLDEVESRFGPQFEAWDGDMGQVEGTKDLLREGFVEDKHPWSLVQSR